MQSCSRGSTKGSDIFQASVSPAGGTLGPISIPNSGGLYEISAKQTLSSNGEYCLAVFTLLNTRKQPLYSFTQEFFYEEGVETGSDEDGPWRERYQETEKKALSDVVIRDNPIYIKVDTQLPPSLKIKQPIQIRLTPKTRSNPFPHGLAGLFILLAAIAYEKISGRLKALMT